MEINYRLWTVCLIQKGDYVNPVKNDRYMIYNYLTTSFSGTLLENTQEGKPVWVHINEVPRLPMQASIRRRFPLFFEEGTFEIQVEWNEEKNQEGKVSIKRT